MEHQSGILESSLNKYFPKNMSICQSSSRHVYINYLSDSKNVYLFLVCADLAGPIKTKLFLDKKYNVTDILKEGPQKITDTFEITIEPGNMKVFKLSNCAPCN